MIDDAYISLRYAVNFADGHGLVYNLGEYVEGYTNFLWVLLLSAFARVGAEPVLATWLLSVASMLVLVASSAGLAWYLTRSIPKAIVAALLVTCPAVIVWGLSGMETCMYATLCVLTLWASMARLPIHAAVAAGLAFWCRPDGGLVGVVVLGVALVRSPRDMRTWVAVGVWLMLVGGLTLWRLYYYGQLVPNTFYAKVGGVQEGWTAQYFAAFWIGAPALLILAGGLARQRAELYVWTAVVCLYVWAVGGDAFGFSRFFVPVIPALAVGAVVATSKSRTAWAAITGALLLNVYNSDDIQTIININRFTNTIGRQHAEIIPKGSTVACVGIGAFGYYAGPTVRIVDMVGLISPEVARNKDELTGHAIPGHQRSNADWVLAQRPDVIYLNDVPLPAILALKSHPDLPAQYKCVDGVRWIRNTFTK